VLLCTSSQGTGPVQVRYADGERDRLGSGPALPFCKKKVLSVTSILLFVYTSTFNRHKPALNIGCNSLCCAELLYYVGSSGLRVKGLHE
jgi:hypothetical protein